MFSFSSWFWLGQPSFGSWIAWICLLTTPDACLYSPRKQQRGLQPQTHPQIPSRTEDGAFSMLGVVDRKQFLCYLYPPDRGVPHLPRQVLSTGPGTVTGNRAAISSAFKL